MGEAARSIRNHVKGFCLRVRQSQAVTSRQAEEYVWNCFYEHQADLWMKRFGGNGKTAAEKYKFGQDS